ncbi:MAG: hypothetical protein GYB68_08305 [Chloroflexi bacterium]|nr:hypothetical protein [Chloroflexota bacterium]
MTIPLEEVEALQAEEGTVLAIPVQRADAAPQLSEELRQAFEESWERNQDGYRSLKGR